MGIFLSVLHGPYLYSNSCEVRAMFANFCILIYCRIWQVMVSQSYLFFLYSYMIRIMYSKEALGLFAL